MKRETAGKRRKLIWILTGAAIMAAVLAVVFWILRPKPGKPIAFVIHYGSGQTLTVPADETRTIVIRNGAIVDTAIGEGDENVIRIENGEAWMEEANCPHRECMKQGRMNEETANRVMSVMWIVCAPHRVSIEYVGNGK